jgi:hypothetical protein
MFVSLGDILAAKMPRPQRLGSRYTMASYSIRIKVRLAGAQPRDCYDNQGRTADKENKISQLGSFSVLVCRALGFLSWNKI